MQGTSASDVTVESFVSSNVKKFDVDEIILDMKLYPVPKFMNQEHCHSYCNQGRLKLIKMWFFCA